MSNFKLTQTAAEVQGILNKVQVNEQNIASKQDRLITGFNYRTINGYSLLGKGNISLASIQQLHDDSFTFPLNDSDKLVCIGDSTTAGVGASAEDKKYIAVLGKLMGAKTTVNLGISGSTLCIGGSRGSNFGALSNEALKSTSSNKTIVTIMIGLNDFDQANDGINTHPAVGTKKQYTLGSPDSTDELTIYGALYKWNEKIKELKKYSDYANTHFIWITPFPTGSAGQGKTDWNPLTQVNYAGYTLRDLCQAVIDMANRYRLPCIDVNLYSGICYNPNNPRSVSQYVPDRLHANDAGYNLIANCIYNWMCGGATRLDKVYLGSGKENTVKLLEALSLSFATQYMFGAAKDAVKSSAITAISFDKNKGSIAAKRKFSLIPIIEPSYASGEGLVYESTDDLVASVNSLGIVTAHQVGTCSIMCRDTINGAYALYTLTVTPEIITPLAKFNLIAPEKLLVNSKNDITLDLLPSNTSQTNFSWEIQPEGLVTWEEIVNGIRITTTKQTGEITVKCTSLDNKELPPATKTLTITRGDPIDLATLTFEDYKGTSEYDTSTHRLTSNYMILSNTPRAAICQQPFTIGKEMRLKLHYDLTGGQYQEILGFCSSNDINKIDSSKEIWSIVDFQILVGVWNIYSDGSGTKTGMPRTAGGSNFNPAVQGHQDRAAYDIWLKWIFDEDTHTILSYYSTTGDDSNYVQIALPNHEKTTDAINLQKQLSELYFYEGHSHNAAGKNGYIDILYFGPRQD